MPGRAWRPQVQGRHSFTVRNGGGERNRRAAVAARFRRRTGPKRLRLWHRALPVGREQRVGTGDPFLLERYDPAFRATRLRLCAGRCDRAAAGVRSEEHPSELQSLMSISYDVFCLKKKKTTNIK